LRRAERATRRRVEQHARNLRKIGLHDLATGGFMKCALSGELVFRESTRIVRR
jgi:hypothetical protein